MSTNNFEKQVRKKMDELDFMPSVAVWEEVEKKIRKRKERRRLLVWLPLLGLLLGSAFWLYKSQPVTPLPVDNSIATTKKNTPVTPITTTATNHSNNDKTITKTTNTNQQKTTATQKEEQTNQPNTVISKEHATTVAAVSNTNTATEKNKTASSASPVVAVDKNTYKKVIVRKGDNQVTTTLSEQQQLTVAANENKTSKQGSGKKPGRVAIESPQKGNVASQADVMAGKKTTANNDLKDAAVVAGNKKDIAVQKDVQSEDNNKNKDTGTAVADNNNKDVTTAGDKKNEDATITTAGNTVVDTISKATVAITTAKDSQAVAVKKQPASGKKKKTEWGIATRGGSSGLSSSISQLFSPARVYDAAYANNITQSGGTNAFPIPARPSAVKSGGSFSLGVFALKHIGKTWTIEAGFSYSYYSTRINVGKKIDTANSVAVGQAAFGLEKSVRTYYTAPGTAGTYESYTNNYHFIELPVAIAKQLGSKSHFSVNTGFSLAMLTGSNALNYDLQKGIYYQDNRLFNKLQANWLAGVNYQFWPQKSFSILVGPQFQYGMTNLFKKEVYGAKHLLHAGISAKILFGKK
jgi:hypothetical protein